MPAQLPSGCAGYFFERLLMKMNQPGSDKSERAESGEREPKGATASDSSGDRHARIKNGVGMGQMDDTGTNKQYNTGRTEGTCYSHSRKDYKG